MPDPSILPGAEPFSSQGGPHGALVLHGFTGSPQSMRGLAEAFAGAGRRPTGRDAIRWAAEAAARGAGELLVTSIDSDGASPWYRNPPACTGAGTNVWPSVYMGSSGVICPVSAKSYVNSPRVSVGHAAGSAATNRVCERPARRSCMKG